MKVYAAEMKSAENEKTEATAAGTTKKSPSQANAESEQPEQQKQQKQLTLTDITWKLNAKESDGDKFDSSKKNEGKCYVYEPVLPETDADGNKLVMADDAELPQIAVLIGGRKVRALSNEVIDIADVEPTGSNGQIVINSENLDDWDNKILTGSVSSSDLNDSAKGIVVDGVTLNLTIFDRPEVHPDIDKVVGDFTTLLPVACRPSADASVEAQMRGVQNELAGGLEHRAVSAVWVQRELARSAGTSGVVLPVVFTSALGLSRFDLDGGFMDYLGGLSQTPQVWLDHQAMERGGGVMLSWVMTISSPQLAAQANSSAVNSCGVAMAVSGVKVNCRLCSAAAIFR